MPCPPANSPKRSGNASCRCCPAISEPPVALVVHAWTTAPCSAASCGCCEPGYRGRTGLPPKYGSYQTAHRRYQQWVEDGTLEEILLRLLADLEERGQIDLSECFVDASFASAKIGRKRGPGVGKTKRGKGSKVLAITDGVGLPVAVSCGSASPHEITLLEDTIEAILTSHYPECLVGDKTYDSDEHDRRVAEKYYTELISPHRRNRKKAKTQAGRVLRRYERRWNVKRLFAWLHNFRWIVTRWKRKLENFEGFVQLGMVRVLLRQF